MAKLTVQKTLHARLRAIQSRYQHSRDSIDWSQPDVATAHEMAVNLQFKVSGAVERWIETVKDHDTAPISNAMLAVATDILDKALQTASNDAAVRSAIASKFLQRFMMNGIETGLLVLPDAPAEEPAPAKRRLFGPNGEML